MEKLINFRLYQKTMSVFSLFSLFIQTFLPFTYFDIKDTFAVDAEPTPIVEQSPTPVPPEQFQEPTAAPTEAPTPTSEPTVVPTAEPTTEPTAMPTNAEPVETPTVAPVEAPVSPTETPAITQICVDTQNYVDSADTDWNINLETGTAETKESVKPGIRYTFPQEKKVSVVFTCLPANESLRSSLKIQQLKVADLNLPEGTNVYGDYAYDITTGMTDGNFKYDITLPKSEDSTAKVSYMENVGGELKSVEEDKVSQETVTVKAESLDHFTIFVATYSSGSFSVEKSSYSRGETVYVKAGDLNTSYYYRLAINPPGGNNTFYIANCFNPDSGNRVLTGSYLLPQNASIDNNWEAELKEFDLSSCGDQNINEPDSDTFAVTAAVTPTPTSTSIPTSTPTPVAVIVPSSVNTINSSCLGTLDSGLTCSANDVSLASVTGIHILDDGCQYPGDDVTFKATWDVQSTANQRYDVGLWFATGGQNSALTGTCSASTLANSPVPPWYDFDQDACGDISSSGPVHPEITMTVKCLDSDGDNTLNLPYCTSWQQNSGDVCSSPANTLPGAPSKCNCENGFEVPINVPYEAKIEVIKNLDPISNAGQFNLSIDNINKSTCVGHTGTTGQITVGAGTSTTPGATHIIGETSCASTNSADYDSSISCVKRATGAIVASGIGTSISVPVQKDDNIVCAITNTRKPFCGDGVVNGNDQCDDGNTNSGDGCSATCQPESSITIIKDAQPNDSQDFSFTFGGVGLTSSQFNLDDDSDATLSNTRVIQYLSPNIYDISEQSVTGWIKELVNCQSNKPWDPQDNFGNGTASFSLIAGENITCTFTNTKNPTLKLVKSVDQGPGQPGNFTLSATGATKSFSDTGDSTTFYTVDPSTAYTLTESSFEGYSQYGLWQCNGGILLSNVVTLNPGENVTCTITNNRDTGSVKVNKRIDLNGDGVWSNSGDENSNSYANSHGFSWVLDGAPRTYGSTISGLTTTLSNYYHNFEEYMPIGYHFISWYNPKDAGKSCTNPNGTTLPDRISVAKDQTTEITLCNARSTGTLIAHKFEDKNNTETQDPGEDNLSGWDMNLYNGSDCQSGNYKRDVDTNSSGNANFGTLVVGNYSVRETLKSGWKNTMQLCQNVTVTKDTTSTVNFGNYRLGSITLGKITTPDQNCADHDKDKFNYTGAFSGEFYDGDTDTFDNLRIGQYVITETAKSGWVLTGIDCSDDTGVTKDLVKGTVTIELTAGKNITCTFKNYKLGRIEGYKFNDLNANRSKDGGENKLSGWTINLDKDKNGSIDTTTTTDANGNYSFNNLTSGWYRVCEVAQTDWHSTLAGGATCIDTEIHDRGGDTDEVIFANRKLGSITVCKIITDTDGKVVNGSEVPGSAFTIDWDRGLNDTVFNSGYTPNTDLFSDVDGNDAYCIPYNNLPINTYHYSQESIASTSAVWQNPLYNDQYETAVNDLGDFYTYNQNTDSNGEINLALDAGVHRTLVILNQYKFGSILVHKFEDENGNGSIDANESGLEGWQMGVYSGSGCNGQVIQNGFKNTDNRGDAQFDNLAPGNYSVKETLQGGWVSTTPECQNITVVAGQVTSVNIGNFEKGSVIVDKYEDTDGVLGRSATESLIGDPTFSFRLYQVTNVGWTLVGQADTDTSGHATFDHSLSSVGEYKVCEVKKDGWEDMRSLNNPANNNSGAADEYQTCEGITVSSSGYRVAPQFGNIHLGTVNVIKYHDLNANGTQDSGEPTLPNWNIILGAQSSQTNASGQATFKAVAGNYNLSETILPGWYQSAITCEDSGDGVKITAPGEAYGHHGNCAGWNGCGNAATCAQWACEVKGYSQVVSYGESRPCTQFGNCNLFYSRGNVQMNWGNWCNVMGVTDIKCSNSTGPTATPTPGDDRLLSWLVKPVCAQEVSNGNSKSIIVEAGKTKTCKIGNYQKATITVNKDVLTYKGEEIKDNFTFNVSGEGKGLGETKTFSENSPATFTVNPGTYKFSEIGVDSRYILKSQNNAEVTVQSGDNKSVTFENWKVQPKLTIAKFNNSWPNNQSHGNQITYTIVLNVLDNDIKDVEVTDLPPFGFKYVPGSYNVTGLSVGISEPAYASPGKWFLGDLKKGDQVVLTYNAVIGDSVNPGLYKDLAYAYGCADTAECLINSADKQTAQSVDSGKLDTGILSGTYVGTKVALATNPEDPKGVNVKSEIGDVLGATTELPSTGAETIWLLVSTLLSVAGLSLLIFKKKMTKIISIIIFTLVILSPVSARAVQSESIFIRLEDPKTPTNVNRFPIDFVAMDQLNRKLTVKCFAVKPDASVLQLNADISLADGGNSGQCTMDNFNLSEDAKTYQFYAVASNGGEEYKSETVSVLYDTSAPGSVDNFGKEKINNCQYKIKFKAANDGQTVKVMIFRSDKTEFTADNSTKVGEVGISPGQEGSYTDIISGDCNKDYYYVARAFDNSGNGSGVVGDAVTVHIGSVQGASTTSTGAIPVTGVNLSKNGLGSTDKDSAQTDSSNGSILGDKEATDAAAKKAAATKGWAIASVVIGLLIIGYGLKKRSEK